MSRVPPNETAFGRRDAPFLVSFDMLWKDPAQDEEAIAWSREMWERIHRFSTGGLYLNWAGLGEEKQDLLRAAYGRNYSRLVELKKKYDPDNFFRLNQNIDPGAAGTPVATTSA